MSRTSSYRSLSCMIGTSIAGPTVIADRSISDKPALSRTLLRRGPAHIIQTVNQIEAGSYATWRNGDQSIGCDWVEIGTEDVAEPVKTSPTSHREKERERCSADLDFQGFILFFCGCRGGEGAREKALLFFSAPSLSSFSLQNFGAGGREDEIFLFPVADLTFLFIYLFYYQLLLLLSSLNQ